jgi:hypothetical protein
MAVGLHHLTAPMVDFGLRNKELTNPSMLALGRAVFNSTRYDRTTTFLSKYFHGFLYRVSLKDTANVLEVHISSIFKTDNGGRTYFRNIDNNTHTAIL